MSSPLRILHLEDDPNDAMLIEMKLKKGGIDCQIHCVESREQFVAALKAGDFELILSDHSLPGFDGMSALALAREIAPEIPYLFVSGTLGEELAIDALQHGATDYVLKQRLGRLAPAVQRALASASERRALLRAEEAMVQSEHKYRQLFECLGEAALLTDARSGRIIDTNRQAEVLFRRTRSGIVGANQSEFLTAETQEEFQRRLPDTAEEHGRVTFQGEATPPGAPAVPVAITASAIWLYGRRLLLGLYRDITASKTAEAEIRKLREELSLRPS